MARRKPELGTSPHAAGPALLILLSLLLRRVSRLDPGRDAIAKLGETVAYAMAVNVFFVALELFTALYSDIPEHVEHFSALVLLLVPQLRRREGFLVAASVPVVASLWIEKGLGMVVTGFVPSPLGHVKEYWPTLPETMIALGIYAVGGLVLTVLYKVAVGVREEALGPGVARQEPAAAETRRELQVAWRGGDRLFPVMLSLRGRRVLVVGGGEVAFRKTQGVLAEGAVPKVIAPEVVPGIEELERRGAIELRRRGHRPGDAAGFALVFAATDDPAVNARVFADGKLNQ